LLVSSNAADWHLWTSDGRLALSGRGTDVQIGAAPRDNWQTSLTVLLRKRTVFANSPSYLF
jgi:hypothetical protein